MKKILVIGNGGREHAIIEALHRSPQKPLIINFANARNPGIAELCEKVVVGDYMNMEAVARVGQEESPDFAIVGPDDPIGAGATDALLKVGIKSFSPLKVCAQLEASKSFTRNLCEKYKIAGQPDYIVSTNANNEKERKDFYTKLNGHIVVKADGLLGGKGVLVGGEHFDDFETAENFALKSIEKFGRVVLEEKFIGEEFSLISLVDGTTVLDCPAIQDHKRAFEGDTGPNTGGMGCVSDEHHSLPFLSEQDLNDAHKITEQTMFAIEKETGQRFVGVMYGGFILTAKGVKLIEYNARFGDPEALNILPILKTDFVTICEKAINGHLSDIAALEFDAVATVVKYLCPEGYPENSVKDKTIKIHQERDCTQCYFASVAEEDGKMLLKGSRAIGVLGTGNNIATALKNCETKIKNFDGPLFYRADIGTSALMKKRVDHINHLKSI